MRKLKAIFRRISHRITLWLNGGRVLFWVGGNGNWDDPLHWSRKPFGEGGENPPTRKDDVIFFGGDNTVEFTKNESITSLTVGINTRIRFNSKDNTIHIKKVKL